MKKAKKVLAGTCALMLCLGISACGNTDSGESSSQVQTVARTDEEIALIEDMGTQLKDIELENTNIKFLSFWDINPGDGEKISPDLMLFQDKYDGTIEYIQCTWNNRYDKLANLVLANDSPDFFSAMDMDGFPMGALKGMFEPMDDYIDFDSELWAPAKPTNDAFVYDGGHYVAAVKSSPDYVCVYNRKTIEENGYDDPAELYWNDEWTWSRFSEMCIDFTDKDADKAGLDGWWYAKALNDTCGVPLIGLEDGKIINNISNPEIAKVQSLMYELQKNEVCFDRGANGWKTRGNGETGVGLASNQTLFIPVGTWAICGIPSNVVNFGDVEADEIMFVPMPRLDDSDTYYVSARVDGYFLCKNAPNPKGFAAYMNCRMATVKDSEELTNITYKEDFKWNDDMIKMIEEIDRLVNEHPVYDFSNGVSPDISTLIGSASSATMAFGEDQLTWTTIVEENEQALDYYLKKANEDIQS